jgi:hypothetical protein
MHAPRAWSFLVLAFAFGSSCKSPNVTPPVQPTLDGSLSKQDPVAVAIPESELQRRIDRYATEKLHATMSKLTPAERRMVELFIEAAEVMDEIYWHQTFGDRDTLLASVSNAAARRYVEINYGPWDRLDGNSVFVSGYGPKPNGGRFYPEDMTKEELESLIARQPHRASEFKSHYTFVRRGKDRELYTVPYCQAYAEANALAAAKLREAASLASDEVQARYLRLRAEALLTDDYGPSDRAWLDMKSNTVDIVIGPVETYDDTLFGTKAAYGAVVVVKDKEESARLERYAELLPELQNSLPVPADYKAETPGSDSDLNAYDVIYYAGDRNARGKAIAINLPNDPVLQLERGTRRLQLKNVMWAKYGKILEPLTRELVHESQHRNVTFNAFFHNTMFHEVSRGLGIKNTLNGRGQVRKALDELNSPIEEAKAAVLALHMAKQLAGDELADSDLMDHYVTYMASILRSLRLGITSAHGRANCLLFGYFMECGAFVRDPLSGSYRLVADKLEVGVKDLAYQILTIQGNGNYAGAKALLEKYGKVAEGTLRDLAKVERVGIPVDLGFEQGPSAWGEC